MQRSGIDTIKNHSRPRTPHGKVTKTQENITFKRAKRLALSQQVATRLYDTEKDAIAKTNTTYKSLSGVEFACYL